MFNLESGLFLQLSSVNYSHKYGVQILEVPFYILQYNNTQFLQKACCVSELLEQITRCYGNTSGVVMWGLKEGVFHPLYCLPNNWIPKDRSPPFTPYLSISQGRIKSCEESIYVLIFWQGLLLDVWRWSFICTE
jgi:hypothetical protein